MSITKSYNKHTDTYYAYDTSYVWDEKLQKKVQKKVCIGKFDPQTGKVIPNAKRGRPGRKGSGRDAGSPGHAGCSTDEMRAVMAGISLEVQEIRESLDGLVSAVGLLEDKISAMMGMLLPGN